MGYKGVIFDLDGVLIHTDEYHYQAWKAIADKNNIPFNRAINNRLRGVSRMDSLEIILESASESFSQIEKEILSDEKNEIYKELLCNLTKHDIEKSVLNTLQYLKKKGYRLAIGSSSKNTKTILDNTELYDYFDAISDGNNITHSKPDPEVFIKAAHFLLLEQKHCVVVEDAKAGIDAALCGGFPCFGIGDAANYDRATWKINTLSDLMMYL